MTALDEALIATINARVAAGERDILAFGTVSSVDSINDVSVTFDGSAASIPCKNFGNVLCLNGDRVGVVKIGAWWTVFGTFSKTVVPHERWSSTNGGAGGTTTSSSFGDTPGLAHCDNFVKYFDDTYLLCQVTIDTFCTVAIAQLEYGVNVSGSGISTFDQRVGAFWHNFTANHQTITEWFAITGATCPAGIYTIKTRWRRLSGTGTLNQDNASDTALIVRETY